MDPKQNNPDKVMSRLSKKLDSNYIRAWCQEWAMDADATERVIEFYAKVEDLGEVLTFMSRMASGQRRRLLRAGKLITLEEFLRDPSLLSISMETYGNTVIDDLIKRLF